MSVLKTLPRGGAAVAVVSPDRPAARLGRAARNAATVAACVSLVAGLGLGAGGCGGGGGTPSSQSGSVDTTTGRATLTVVWPVRDPSRLVPVASNSIKVTMADAVSGAVVAERVLVRPGSGGSTTATFAGLPVGSLIATAAAYPTQDATGVAQATASVPVTIVSGVNAGLDVDMASTIATFEVTPGGATLDIGQTRQLTAAAKDGAGNVVLTSAARVRWQSSAPGVVTVDDAGKLFALAAGSADVTATETESGKSATVRVTVASPAQNVRSISLRANDLVWDANTRKLYATIPSSVGAGGNSIRSIDPDTLEVGPAVFLGSEPGPMAISGDGRYIYVGLTGAPKVRRYDVATATAGMEFPLGSDSFTGAYYAEQIEVQPGNPDVVAVSRRNVGFSPRHEGVVVYDNGVPRVRSTPDHTGANVIEFGPNPNRLYGYNNETTGFNYYRMIVDAEGVRVEDDFDSFDGPLLSGFGVDIEYDNGRIYATSGRVIDAEAKIPVGTFAASGPVRPDSALGRVFFATGGDSFGTTAGTVVLKAFDPATFIEVDSLTISGVTGAPASLVRWGAKGLAFRTTGGRIYIINRAPGT
jgi:sugar lactone lactonase YvrE